LFNFIPKKLGYPKTGKYLAIIFGLFVLTIILWTAFEDQLFTKDNAKELVEEQQIILTDEFELTENKSNSAIGDYYHTFTLKLSDRDKQNAISKIISADNFKKDNSSVDQTLYLSDDRYFGPKVTQNYETEKAFVREYFQPSGQKGYAPTFRRISISKSDNELTFEDIDE
jgi:ribosomal protein S17E